MTKKTSPFKFLDSYQREDADVFFGREEETEALYGAMSGVKHLLVYGASGAGKTSLVECGLRNQFSDADWFALTIRKGDNINTSVFKAISEELEEELPISTKITFGEAIEKLFEECYQPIYLLFDQFEELLLLGKEEEKRNFFQRLNQLIKHKVPCRIMLIMREEFIGHLSEFEHLCPSIFQHRFRLEKMGRSHVKQVIQKTLKAPKYSKSFIVQDDGEKLATKILNSLPGKQREVELSHVQVFLDQLWERGSQKVSGTDIPTLSGDLVNKDDKLEKVLNDFLQKQLKELESKYGKNIPLEILSSMISEKHTKLQLSTRDLQEDLNHKKINLEKPLEDLLNSLEQRRIIRSIKLGHQTQYEISHDTLALVVGQNLTEEMKLREKARDIYNVYGDREGYLTQQDLDHLRPYKQYLDYPKELGSQVNKSEVYIIDQEKKKIKEANMRVKKSLGVAVIAVSLAIVAVFFYFKAEKERSQAQIQAITAESLVMTSQARDWVRERLYNEASELLNIAYDTIEKYNIEAPVPLQKLLAEIYYGEDTYWKQAKFQGHAKEISSVAFSPDGRTVLTGSWDSTAMLWDLEGKPLQTFKGHTSSISSIAFSPDGRSILTGSWDNTAILWDLQGKPIQTFKGHTGSINSVAFSPDGKSILTGSYDSTAILWDLQGKQIQTFKGHTEKVTSVAFSPDGRSVLTGSQDNTAILWNLNGRIIQKFKGHFDYVGSVAFSPDGRRVLTGSWDNTAILWNLEGKSIQTFKGHSSAVRSVTFSPSGKQVLTGFWDHETILWNLDGNPIQRFEVHTDLIASVSFSPDGKQLLTGSHDNTAILWSLKGKAFVQALEGGNGVFSPDGSQVLTGAGGDEIALWNLEGSPVQRFKAHTDDITSRADITSIAFSPEGNQVLTGGMDNTAILWDLEGNQVQVFKGHTGYIHSVAFSPNGRYILTAGDDLTVILWSLEGNSVERFRASYSTSFAIFSPDGGQVLIGGGNTATLYNLDGRLIQAFNGHRISSIAFSPNGRQVLTGSYDYTATLWNLDGSTVQTFKKHSGSSYSTSVAFSPNGRQVITGSKYTSTLWNLDGSPIQTFKGRIESITSVAFSPDGSQILMGSKYTSIRKLTPQGIRHQTALFPNQWISPELQESIGLPVMEVPSSTNLTPWVLWSHGEYWEEKEDY